MRISVTIKNTSRNDGLGNPVSGWYVCDYGVPLGRPYDSEMEAKGAALNYARDVSLLNRQVGR